MRSDVTLNEIEVEILGHQATSMMDEGIPNHNLIKDIEEAIETAYPPTKLKNVTLYPYHGLNVTSLLGIVEAHHHILYSEPAVPRRTSSISRTVFERPSTFQACRPDLSETPKYRHDTSSPIFPKRLLYKSSVFCTIWDFLPS